MRASRTATSGASGTDALEVLEYSSTVTSTRSIGSFSFLAAALIMYSVSCVGVKN